MRTEHEESIRTNQSEKRPSEINGIKTRILSYFTNSSSSIEIGVFNFNTAPLVGDVIIIPTHPPLRVIWRRFVQHDEQTDITIACSYAEAQDPETEIKKRLDIKEYKESHIEIQTKTFDKATIYTNAVIIAGYAAAFTIWSTVKDKVSDQHNATIGLLLSISFIFFISFEIMKMILTSISMKKSIEALEGNEKNEDYLEILSKTNQKIGAENATFMKYWPLFLALTITPATAATILLFYDFIVIIFK